MLTTVCGADLMEMLMMQNAQMQQLMMTLSAVPHHHHHQQHQQQHVTQRPTPTELCRLLAVSLLTFNNCTTDTLIWGQSYFLSVN